MAQDTGFTKFFKCNPQNLYMESKSQLAHLNFIHICSFVIFLFCFIVLFLLYSTIFFEPLLIVFLILLFVYILIIRNEKEYARYTPQIIQFLSPIPSNINNPLMNSRWIRLKMVLIRAFIAESKMQIKKAAKFYYFALKIDKEIGEIFSQKLLLRLDKLELTYLANDRLRKEHQTLENIISDFIKQAQEFELNNDLIDALRIYKKIRFNQMRLHHYHNTFHTDEIIQQLNHKLSGKNKKLD